jgi:DNA-binding CsgD family transcriptional regulator
MNYNRPLTHREIEILRTMGQGYSTKEAGEIFSISSETIRSHLLHISRKLGTSSILHAVAVARAIGIINDTEYRAGAVAMRTLRDYHHDVVGGSNYPDLPDFVEFNGSMKAELKEGQLVPFRPDPQSEMWIKLSGWISWKSDSFNPSIRLLILSDVRLRDRRCPVGHKVDVTVNLHGAEYSTGLFMTVTWPRSVQRKRIRGSSARIRTSQVESD